MIRRGGKTIQMTVRLEADTLDFMDIFCYIMRLLGGRRPAFRPRRKPVNIEKPSFLPLNVAATLFHAFIMMRDHAADAGSVRVERFDAELQKTLGLNDGRVAFGEENWPVMDPTFIIDICERCAKLFDIEESKGSSTLPAPLTWGTTRQKMLSQDTRFSLKFLSYRGTHPDTLISALEAVSKELIAIVVDAARENQQRPDDPSFGLSDQEKDIACCKTVAAIFRDLHLIQPALADHLRHVATEP